MDAEMTSDNTTDFVLCEDALKNFREEVITGAKSFTRSAEFKGLESDSTYSLVGALAQFYRSSLENSKFEQERARDEINSVLERALLKNDPEVVTVIETEFFWAIDNDDPVLTKFTPTMLSTYRNYSSRIDGISNTQRDV